VEQQSTTAAKHIFGGIKRGKAKQRKK